MIQALNSFNVLIITIVMYTYEQNNIELGEDINSQFRATNTSDFDNPGGPEKADGDYQNQIANLLNN
jgi:hypothetical protein